MMQETIHWFWLGSKFSDTLLILEAKSGDWDGSAKTFFVRFFSVDFVLGPWYI